MAYAIGDIKSTLFSSRIQLIIKGKMFSLCISHP